MNPDPTFTALTLWPEWAWAICHLGKDVENRSIQMTSFVQRAIGKGWLAIHAGVHVGGRPGFPATREGVWSVCSMATRAGWADDQRLSGDVEFSRQGVQVYLSLDAIPKGAIVALVRIGPGSSSSPWAVPGQGQIGLLEVRPLPRPVPCKGAQGLWTPPTSVCADVQAQLFGGAS